MYGICCVPFFFRKTACQIQEYFQFQIPSQKSAQIVNLKNPDLDLIRRIHPECRFYGFMIRFWICLKKRKIRFWISKSGFGFSPKNAPSESTFQELRRRGLRDICQKYEKITCYD